MLEAIITLAPDDCTLGSLRRFLHEADHFSVPRDTPLLDGGHVSLASDETPTVGSYGRDIAAVAAFLDGLGDLPDETELAWATDLAVDLPVFAVGPITCGEHVGASPENVIVTVNPACREHDA